MACGRMILKKHFKLKKKLSFYFITFNFLMLLLLHKTLKGSRKIQGFALIRAVLFILAIEISNFFETFTNYFSRLVEGQSDYSEFLPCYTSIFNFKFKFEMYRFAFDF